jgi:hypothetical protein
MRLLLRCCCTTRVLHFWVSLHRCSGSLCCWYQQLSNDTLHTPSPAHPCPSRPSSAHSSSLWSLDTHKRKHCSKHCSPTPQGGRGGAVRAGRCVAGHLAGGCQGGGAGALDCHGLQAAPRHARRARLAGPLPGRRPRPDCEGQLGEGGKGVEVASERCAASPRCPCSRCGCQLGLSCCPPPPPLACVPRAWPPCPSPAPTNPCTSQLSLMSLPPPSSTPLTRSGPSPDTTTTFWTCSAAPTRPRCAWWRSAAPSLKPWRGSCAKTGAAGQGRAGLGWNVALLGPGWGLLCVLTLLLGTQPARCRRPAAAAAGPSSCRDGLTAGRAVSRRDMQAS